MHWLRPLTKKAGNALKATLKVRSLSKFGSIGWGNSFVVSGTWIGTCKREQGHTASSMLSDNDLPVAHSDCKDLFAD